MLLFELLVIFAILQAVDSTKIGCQEQELELTESVDCGTLLYYFSESNVEQTLHCIGYRKTQPPRTSKTHNRSIVEIRRQIDQVTKFDEQNGLIELKEHYSLISFDERLRLNCQNGDGEMEVPYEGPFVKRTFWTPTFLSGESGFIPKFDNLFLKLNSNDTRRFDFFLKNADPDAKVMIRCEMRYDWFPFDTQNCSHPFTILSFLKRGFQGLVAIRPTMRKQIETSRAFVYHELVVLFTRPIRTRKRGNFQLVFSMWV